MQASTVRIRACSALIAAATAAACTANVNAAPKPLPDTCGAGQYMKFIGKPVSDMEALQPPDSRFVCREDCVTTADFRASRLTVIYARKTGRILRISCG